MRGLLMRSGKVEDTDDSDCIPELQDSRTNFGRMRMDIKDRDTLHHLDLDLDMILTACHMALQLIQRCSSCISASDSVQASTLASSHVHRCG